MDNWTNHFNDDEQILIRGGLLALSLRDETNGDAETAAAAKDLLRKLNGQPAIG